MATTTITTTPIYNGLPNNTNITTLDITQLSNITYGPITSINSIPSVGATGVVGSSYSYSAGSYTTSGPYTIGVNTPYITTTIPQGYGYANNYAFDTNWLNPLQHTIKIDDEIKYVSKVEAEEIVKKYLILEKMCEEFPQIKYEKDKLEALIKLHTADESNNDK